MKRALIIPVLLLAWIVFCSKQCAEERDIHSELETQLEEVEKVKSNFGSKILDTESLYAFEEKAKQKLIDYSDYFNIANDHHFDTAFRQQAAELVDELFMNNKVPEINIHVGSGILVDSSVLIQPLSRISESRYMGLLGFNMKVFSFDTTEIVARQSVRCTVEMIVAKKIVILGDDSIQAWKVFLGEWN